MTSTQRHQQVFQMHSPYPVSAQFLYDWHAQPGAFQKLLPPWEKISHIQEEGGFTEGGLISFRIHQGPFQFPWVARLHSIVPGESFQDEQLKGPFVYWNHTHRFIETDSKQSILEDHILYQLPLDPLSTWIANGLVQHKLKRLFTYRHAVLRQELLTI